MNTFPTINRLPPEVLALIPSFLTSHKDLVFTTHVCRHWRKTIIASPSLWSHLDNDAMHQNLVAVYMDRCGGVPLDVTFSSDMGKNISFVEKIVFHSSHIRDIRIPYHCWHYVAKFSDAFIFPLPSLRAVDLSIGHDISLPQFERPFFAEATNMVSLRLSDCNLNSGTLLHFIIPTLTHLALTFIEPRIPIVGELLELLRNSPLVESLQIDADVVLDVPEEDSAFPTRFQSVNLLYLRDVRLNWVVPRSQHTLLAHIQHPSNCSISMQARSDGNAAEPPRAAFPKSWDAFSLSDLSCVTLRMKREQMWTECAVIITKSNGSSISISLTHCVDGFIMINGDGEVVREPNRDRDDDQILSEAITLIRKLPLHWIRKFVLEDFKADEMSKPESFEIPPALVELICSEMPNLTTLTLTRTCVTELLDMLTPPPPPPLMYLADLFYPNTTLESSTPCPILKVLEMRHPVWTSPRNCREVLALAKARKHEEAPFERVFFCSPSVPMSIALGLSMYVGDVDIRYCDGCE